MSQVWIDQDAINNTHSCLSAMSQDIQHRATQHNQLVGDIERALSTAWGEMTRILDPAHALTEGDVWGRFGFDGLLMRYVDIRGSVEQFHSTATTSLTHLCQAHAGQIGADFADHAARIQGHLANAHGGLWNVSGLLNPGSILWLASNAWELLNPLQGVYGELVGAAAAMTAFTQVLDEVDAEVQRLLRQLDGAPASPSGSAGTTPVAPVVVPAGHIPGSPGPDGGSTPTQPQLTPLQQRLQTTAEEYASYLQNSSKPPHQARFNMLNMNTATPNSVPQGQQDFVTRYINGQNGYSTLDDVQCVAFVGLVYGLAFNKLDALPTHGNANQLYDNFNTPQIRAQGWSETSATGLTNPVAQIHVGDIMTLQGGASGLGHVAIVTHVTATSVEVAQSNSIGPTLSFPIHYDSVTHTYSVDGTALGQSYSAQGFIHYSGTQ